MVGSQSDSISPGLILLAVSLCTMLHSLTMTIVNVVLPQLQGALSATPEQVSWVVTSNVIATAVFTPATGWVAGRFGHRRVMLGAVIGFSICSLLCAMADSLESLLVFRVGQGAFGAPLVPLSQATIVAVYPPARRAFAQGIFGMSVVLGPALAPMLGGYVAETYNWRFVFIIILPVCVAAFVMTWLWVRGTEVRSTTRLDWTGFVACSIVITCAQLAMDRGERLDWWASSEILAYVSLMCVALWVFIVHTATADRPFVNPRLFLDRNFSIGVLLVFVYGMLQITPTVMLPTMLQNLMGYPDSMIGNLLASRGAGMVVGFFAVIYIGKLDPRAGMILGIAAIGLSGWNMAQFNLETAPLTVALNGILQGIGSAILWVPLTIVAFATLDERLLPDASAIFHLLRHFGTSIFISVNVLVVSRTGRISYAELGENITPFAGALKDPAVMERWPIDTVTGLSSLAAEVNRQAMMIGYTNSFALYAVVSFAVIPLMLLVKIKK
jgi:DHA2 family multidrug resistance protein